MSTTETPPQALTMDPEKQKTDKFFESNAGDGTTTFEQYTTGIPLIMSFASCCIALFLIGLDQTIVVTLLNTVGTDFDAYDKVGWVASGYMLTMAVFAQTWGRLSIIFGRKYSLLSAIVLFEGGSLMCALAPNMNTLIGGRIFAGIGGGGIQTLVFVIGSEMVPINMRPIAFALMGITFGVSSVIGPLIGGGFTENVTWRWCFYINLPLGGIAFIAFVFFFHPPFPKFTLREKFEEIDYIGTFLLTSGLVLFLLGLTFGGQDFPWKSGAVISCFILGGLLLIVFCVWNFKYSKKQIIPLVIIRKLTVIPPLVTLFLGFYAFMGLVVYSSAFFQIVHGAGPISMGVQFFPYVIPVVIATILSGVLMRRTRYIKHWAILGAIAGAVGFGLMTLLDENSGSSAKIGYLILPGISFALLLQCSIMSAQLEAPKEAGSTILVTSLFGLFRSLGGAIGADLAQVIFNSSLTEKIQTAIKNNSEAFAGFDASDMTAFMNNPSSVHQLPDGTKQIVLHCIMGSIRNVFYTSAAVSCLTVVSTSLFSNQRLPQDSEMAQQQGILRSDDVKLSRTGSADRESSVKGEEAEGIVEQKS